MKDEIGSGSGDGVFGEPALPWRRAWKARPTFGVFGEPALPFLGRGNSKGDDR